MVLGSHRVLSPHRFLGPHRILGPHRVLDPGSSQGPGSGFSGIPIDRSFKICNNWNSFHIDIENIKSNLIRNAYPPFLIDKIIKRYLNHKISSNQNQ